MYFYKDMQVIRIIVPRQLSKILLIIINNVSAFVVFRLSVVLATFCPQSAQLFKLAKNTNAKKEDDEVYFEDNELALAA